MIRELDAQIGVIEDVLVGNDGKVQTVIVGVGNCLGMETKSVAAPFNLISRTTKDGKIHLTLNTTKEALKVAPALKYDPKAQRWVAEALDSEKAVVAAKVLPSINQLRLDQAHTRAELSDFAFMARISPMNAPSRHAISR